MAPHWIPGLGCISAFPRIRDHSATKQSHPLTLSISVRTLTMNALHHLNSLLGAPHIAFSSLVVETTNVTADERRSSIPTADPVTSMIMDQAAPETPDSSAARSFTPPADSSLAGSSSLSVDSLPSASLLPLSVHSLQIMDPHAERTLFERPPPPSHSQQPLPLRRKDSLNARTITARIGQLRRKSSVTLRKETTFQERIVPQIMVTPPPEECDVSVARDGYGALLALLEASRISVPATYTSVSS